MTSAETMFFCLQVVGEYGMAHFSDTGKSNGKDYCIFFNSQWARLPQDLNKAVSILMVLLTQHPFEKLPFVLHILTCHNHKLQCMLCDRAIRSIVKLRKRNLNGVASSFIHRPSFWNNILWINKIQCNQKSTLINQLLKNLIFIFKGTPSMAC